MGRSLFYQLPLFANPLRWWVDGFGDWLQLWQITQQLGVPLAQRADEVNARDAEAMLIFHREIAEIRKAEQDGRQS